MAKTYIKVFKNKIPVYYEEKDKKYVKQLPKFLEKKFNNGKGIVRTYIGSLDSIELEGKEANLFSHEDIDTLQLSVS